ncbi:MAG: DUF488 domain-containing protein [Nitrospirae bacterium]|nr:DUF488 domain-containing protein [Nitrospirota bacterium]
MNVHLYTIGFSGKTAEEFFKILKSAGIKILLDVRLNNTSQLAGFTKSKDLKYFVKVILNGQYIYLSELAPTKELLKKYLKDKDWVNYEKEYLELLQKREIKNKVDIELLTGPSVMLCSEKSADKCHRRLAAEYIQKKLLPKLKIVHL